MKRIILWLIIMLFYSIESNSQTPNSWARVANFGGTSRAGGIAFSIGSFGYAGFGAYVVDTIAGIQFPTDFWQYNPSTNTWVQKANFPASGRSGAVCFVIGSKAYIGLGEYPVGDLNDFWEYDPATDTWTQKNNFPGGRREGAVGFSIGNKGYVATGATDSSSYLKDNWEYDVATDMWTQKADFGGAGRNYAMGFSIAGHGYIGLGAGEFSAGQYLMQDLWQYDTATDSWTQKPDFAGGPLVGTFTFVIGDKAYAGTGVDSLNNTYSAFWEYNSLTDQWIEKDSFGGGIRGYAVGFSIENKGYAGIGTASNIAHCTNDFWMYTPVSIFPDPTSNKLYINTSLKNISVSIADMAGQSWPVFLSGSEIDVSALPAGVYCLRIQDSSGSVVRKFVKE